jgi:hypothetical protein
MQITPSALLCSMKKSLLVELLSQGESGWAVGWMQFLATYVDLSERSKSIRFPLFINNVAISRSGGMTFFLSLISCRRKTFCHHNDRRDANLTCRSWSAIVGDLVKKSVMSTRYEYAAAAEFCHQCTQRRSRQANVGKLTNEGQLGEWRCFLAPSALRSKHSQRSGVVPIAVVETR